MSEVERVQVEPIPQRPKPVFVSPPQAQAPEPRKENQLLKTLSAILPIFGALASILAIRLFLLFAIVGAFILAQAALSDENYHGIWVLVAYCSFTILPLVWLDIQGKRKGE